MLIVYRATTMKRFNIFRKLSDCKEDCNQTYVVSVLNNLGNTCQSLSVTTAASNLLIRQMIKLLLKNSQSAITMAEP